MQRSAVVFVTVLLGFLLIGTAKTYGQYVYARPTPTPTSKPTPEPKQLPCPQITVQSQNGQQIREGQPVSFIVNIIGGDNKFSPNFVWNVSAGVISSGQNTQRIVVDSTGAGATADREIAADVWVGGYAPECVLQATAKVKVIPSAVKFGEFGVVPDETVKTNLKALASFLSQSPDNLWLIVYAGRNSERGFAMNWAKRIKDELVANGISTLRIIAMDGGFREEPLFDFWTVPLGADPPRPAPTVDRREIVYPKVPPAKKP